MRLLYYAITIILFIGCTNNYKPDYSNGFVELKINENSEKLEGRGVYITDNDFESVFYLKNKNGYDRMVIGFINIRTELGTYSLTNQAEYKEFSYGASLLTAAADGDVIEDTYVLKSETNTITVESYNDDTGTITGTFDITFHINENYEKVNPSNPDIFTLKDAYFEVYLK